MWAVKPGDKPVAWRGQRGQGSCRNGPGRTVVTDRKRKVEEGGGCEQKRGDGHREGAAWSVLAVLAIAAPGQVLGQKHSWLEVA